MAFTAYADNTALGGWLGGAVPANSTALLRAATFLVAAACNRDPYTDSPSADEAAILSDATCAQVEAWLANGVDPAAGGLDVRVVTESKVGTGDVKFDALPAAQVAESVTAIAPQVRSILLSGGLLWQPAPVGADPCDPLPHWGIDDWRIPPYVIINS